MSQTAGPNIHLGFISRLESIRIRINENDDQNQDCNGIKISKIKFRIRIRIRTRMKSKIGIILLLRRRITISEGSELLQRSICWFDPAPCSTFPGAFVQQGFHWFHPTLFVQQPHMCTEQNSHWFGPNLIWNQQFFSGEVTTKVTFIKNASGKTWEHPTFLSDFWYAQLPLDYPWGGLKMHIWWRPTPM